MAGAIPARIIYEDGFYIRLEHCPRHRRNVASTLVKV